MLTLKGHVQLEEGYDQFRAILAIIWYIHARVNVVRHRA